MRNKLKNILTGSLVIMTLALMSCETKSRLAKDLEGTWASETPSQLGATGDVLNASATEFLQFNTDEGVSNPEGGMFQLMAMVSVTSKAHPSDGLTEPYSYSGTGTALLTGKWKVVDEDKISLVLDPNAIIVNVDPEGVVLEDNILSGENAVMTDSLKPAIVSVIESTIKRFAVTNYSDITEIDDIEVKGDRLKCEIKDKDVYFHRQGETEIEMKK